MWEIHCVEKNSAYLRDNNRDTHVHVNIRECELEGVRESKVVNLHS